MTTNDPTPDEDSSQRHDSAELASFIIDALFQAGIVQEARFQEAIEIATEEIDVWKLGRADQHP